jgi:hypothetical protein
MHHSAAVRHRGRCGNIQPGNLLKSLGPEPWNVAYAEPSFRPDDGRYGENPNRMQMHYQFQVILKPDPGDPQQLYLNSLYALGIKREDLCHTGAHKMNNTMGQILLARRMGKPRIIAETGAGQHGVATATACALFGFECEVYMGEEDVHRQALNVFRMELLGAKVTPVLSGTRQIPRDSSLPQAREACAGKGRTLQTTASGPSWRWMCSRADLGSSAMNWTLFMIWDR